MFGFGSNKRQMRNDTFSSNRVRNAALAGVGMLAWRWWKNRQTSNQPNNYQNRSFSDSETRQTGSF
jgi:uncharacterized membrane protein YebE (DUF533 family)